MILHSQILGQGKPFVILHGFLGMSDNWKTLGNQFAENFEVHLIDQRNHGRSFHSPDHHYEALSEDLKQYFDHHNIEEAIVLGHSMGGKTAMFFASKYPELVSHLIVADISPRFYPIHHDTILSGLNSFDFKEIKSRGAADKQLANYIPQVSVRQFLLKNLYWKEKGKLAFRMNLEALTENVSEVGEALPLHFKFDKNTLFLKGDKSEYIGTQDEAIIKRQFPKANIITITNAGHWLHAENPEQFYEAVINFVN